MALTARERLPDWERRLGALVDAWRSRDFSWGRADCAVLAAESVEAVTGLRPSLPAYRSERGAALALRRMGAASLAQAASSILGEPVSTGMLLRGDIVCDGRALGIWWYASGACGLFVGARGLEIVLPAADWIGWQVPCRR